MTDQDTQPVTLPMAGAPPRERGDAAANRTRILQAARRLLAQRGADGLTMDAVACEAGVGKGTVFRRFGDRAGLAEALVDDHMRDFQDRMLHGPPPLGPGAPPAERLEAFVVELLRLQAANLEAALVAETAPGHRRSMVFGALLFHVRTLVREIEPELDDAVVARMILSAVAPSVIVDAGERGVDRAVLETSALAVLRGLTCRAAGGRRARGSRT